MPAPERGRTDRDRPRMAPSKARHPAVAKQIEINRAPVLTLWAAVVAERLGFDRDEALTLGKAVAGLNAYSKGRALCLFQPKPKDIKEKRRALRRGQEITVDLLSRATTTDIAPALLFALNDHVTDYLWVRPYVGAAAHIGRSSRTDLIFPDVTESANTIGFRAFFGGEMSLSSLPQFAVSADVGYYKLPDPFVGFEPGGMGFSISGHWYVK